MRGAAKEAFGTEEDAVKQDVRETGVHDHVALDEIELYGEVLSAVAASDGPLTQEEIDVVLGVRRQRASMDLP